MDKPSFEFECASCQATDTVPFSPEPGLLCRECLKAEREIRTRHAPSRKHNTRVSLPITCFKCGKHETLDHMPKGKKIEELMCTACTAETLGVKSRWNKVVKQKKEEQPSSWRVSCCECGVNIFLNTRPGHGREYMCESCDLGVERAKPDLLKGTEELTGGVRKRS